MKRIKKCLGNMFVLLIACLSVGALVSASNSMSTEVQIAIEGSDIPEGSGDGTNEQTRKAEYTHEAEDRKSVQTGDDKKAGGYLLAIGVAVLAGLFSFARGKKKGFVAVVALFLSLFFMSHSAYAADSVENVSVTIPSSISVVFEKTGKNSISDFSIDNESLVPISVDKIKVTECNGWKLCDNGESIPVDTKQLSFIFDGQSLKAGENLYDMSIAEYSSKNCNLQINRGAWTTAKALETAMQMEFEYSIGKKEFQLTFDVNGGTQTVAPQMICNGDTISLPSVEREGYALAGWEDSDGKLYTGKYVMPIGDTTLTARWKETKAYAIYIAEDTSLRFIQSAEPVTAGSSYKGMTVTDVFTGFDTQTYGALAQIPWYDGDWYETRRIKTVIVEDVIQPVNTAYWFYHLHELEYIDVSKLDTSKVTNMSYMFYKLGWLAPQLTMVGFDKLNTSNVTKMVRMFCYAAQNTPNFVIDISGWDVSKVTDMYRMFTEVAYNATTFSLGDLSKWNVSNVTDMYEMFINVGYHAEWYMDLSGWNVSKVKSHAYFDSGIDRKIGDPRWVY